MAQLVDTSIFIGLERRGLPVGALAHIAPDDLPTLASISASELFVGVHRADSPARRQRREAFVEEILAVVPLVPFDLRVARTHAALWAELTAAGQLIGAHDLIIAATALAHGYAVLTDNPRDFGRVPGLVIHRPTW